MAVTRLTITYRDINSHDLEWVREILTDAWASTQVVSRGTVHVADKLPGIVAMINGEALGLLTYSITGSDLEIVTLNALRQREGIGSGLIAELERIARRENCLRIWVITTNDNTDAVSFYEAQGFRIVAVHRDAIKQSRRLKPEIPMTGIDGVPITDEIELEKILD